MPFCVNVLDMQEVSSLVTSICKTRRSLWDSSKGERHFLLPPLPLALQRSVGFGYLKHVV